MLTTRQGAAGDSESVAPTVSLAGDHVDQPHDRLDEVVDVGEVALHLAVAVDLDRLALKRGATNLNSAMSGRPHGP